MLAAVPCSLSCVRVPHAARPGCAWIAVTSVESRPRASGSERDHAFALVRPGGGFGPPAAGRSYPQYHSKDFRGYYERRNRYAVKCIVYMFPPNPARRRAAAVGAHTALAACKTFGCPPQLSRELSPVVPASSMIHSSVLRASSRPCWHAARLPPHAASTSKQPGVGSWPAGPAASLPSLPSPLFAPLHRSAALLLLERDAELSQLCGAHLAPLVFVERLDVGGDGALVGGDKVE